MLGHALHLYHGHINPWSVRFAEPLTAEEMERPIRYTRGKLFIDKGKFLTPKFMTYGLGNILEPVSSPSRGSGEPDIAREYMAPEQTNRACCKRKIRFV